MEEQIKKAIDWVKSQNIDACITGSCLLEINPEWNQDIDVFCFSEKSFTELYFAMYHSSLFTILDKLEIWKSDQFRTKESFNSNKHVSGVTTIKFMFNTCIPVNIILKKNCTNIFSVLSSFDIDIICKGYDLKSKQHLDLTGDSVTTKIASWNKWNPRFNNTEIWSVSRILRQLERSFKYYKRGYNTDDVVVKYIELIDKVQEFESIFSSENFNEKLKITQENTKIVKQICEVWLITHEITETQVQLLQTKIKEI